jgi:hypothetical protein
MTAIYQVTTMSRWEREFYPVFQQRRKTLWQWPCVCGGSHFFAVAWLHGCIHVIVFDPDLPPEALVSSRHFIKR